MVSLMDLSMYTATISTILLFGLILVYARIYRETRAQFSLGLLVFALILFAQNLLAAYCFLTMSPFIGEPFLPYLLAVNTTQVLQILVLLLTTVNQATDLDQNPTNSRNPDTYHHQLLSRPSRDLVYIVQ